MSTKSNRDELRDRIREARAAKRKERDVYRELCVQEGDVQAPFADVGRAEFMRLWVADVQREADERAAAEKAATEKKEKRQKEKPAAE